MANTYASLGDLFKSIADAIREKSGSTESIPASEFPNEILKLAEAGKDLFVEIATGEVTTIQASDLEGITSIGPCAFNGCTKLKSVTLPSSITTIGANAFANCTNLTTINVPWAKNNVSGAPWGSSATINYNYGG